MKFNVNSFSGSDSVMLIQAGRRAAGQAGRQARQAGAHNGHSFKNRRYENTKNNETA